MEKVEEILIEIQDKLVPILDSYEQAIYHYLFRHTYLVGVEKCHPALRFLIPSHTGKLP